MALFAKALRCLYQDKDAVYLWPEGFAACAAVCTESRASLDGVWTDLDDGRVRAARGTLQRQVDVVPLRLEVVGDPQESYNRVRRHRNPRVKLLLVSYSR